MSTMTDTDLIDIPADPADYAASVIWTHENTNTPIADIADDLGLSLWDVLDILDDYHDVYDKKGK